MSQDYKVDLRWEDGGRLTDRTITPDRTAAFVAFRALLARDDLDGQAVAVRFVADGRSLYFSRFDRPFGKGRIRPDAPIRADVDRAEADRLAAWTPSDPGLSPRDRATQLTHFIVGRGWSVDDVKGVRLDPAMVARAVLDFVDGGPPAVAADTGSPLILSDGLPAPDWMNTPEGRAVMAAMARLFDRAQGDGPEADRVKRLLLAFWDVPDVGAFIDRATVHDVAVVFAYLATLDDAVTFDQFGFRKELHSLLGNA